MDEGARYVTIRDYLRVIRERRIVIVLVTIVFTAAALGYSLRQPTVYAAETSVEFQNVNVDTQILGQIVATSEQTPEQRAALGAQTVTRPEVAERAREILRSTSPVGALQGAVAAFPEARTHLVVISARWGDAQFAAKLADAFAKATQEVTTREARDRFARAARAQRRIRRELGDSESQALTRSVLSAQIARLEELAEVVSPVDIRRQATVPVNPVAPKPVRNMIIGFLLGLVLGALAGFARDALDRRFRGSHEITDALKLPLVGYVREDALGRSVVAANGNGRPPLDAQQLETFRILRTNVEFLDVDNPVKTLLVTSALPEEGKSTVSAALAATYALAGKKTLLVECDLRRPNLAQRMGLNAEPGLTDYLVGHAAPAEVLQTVEIAPPAGMNGQVPGAARPVPLVCIVAGSPSPQPAELLRSKRAKDFLAQVQEVYDIVVLDTCPLLSVVDTLELLPSAQGVLMCVRASRTTREQAKAAKAALEHLPERPAGVVVTGARGRDEAEQYGYYPGYAYGGR